MLNPRPRSLLTSSIIWISLLHIASPVKGSKDRDFILARSTDAEAPIARDPSDLALTSRSPDIVQVLILSSKGDDNMAELLLAHRSTESIGIGIGKSFGPFKRAQTMQTFIGSSFNSGTTSPWFNFNNSLPLT